MALSVCFVFTITIGVFPAITVDVKTTVVAEGNGWSECVCTSLYPCSYSFSLPLRAVVSQLLRLFHRDLFHPGVLLPPVQPDGLGRQEPDCCLYVGTYVCVCVCVWWSDADASHTCCCECFIRAWIRRSICFLYLTVPSWVFVEVLLNCDLAEQTRATKSRAGKTLLESFSGKSCII